MSCDNPTPIYGLASVANPKWDGGARSVDSFAGDGYVRFSTSGESVGVVAGLSNFDSGPNVGDIDYGIIFKYKKYAVVENGSQQTEFDSFSDSDDFYIQRVGKTVYYMLRPSVGEDEPDYFLDDRVPGVFLPGNIVYVSQKPSSGEVFLDASLYVKGDALINEQIQSQPWSVEFLGDGPNGDGSGDLPPGSSFGAVNFSLSGSGVVSPGATAYQAAGFLAMPPFQIGPLPEGGAAFATWDTNQHLGGTLSNGNETFTQTLGSEAFPQTSINLGETGKSSAEQELTYFEFTVDQEGDTSVDGKAVGLGFKFDDEDSYADSLSYYAYGEVYSFHELGGLVYGAGALYLAEDDGSAYQFNTGDVVGMLLAYDTVADTVDMHIWINGTAATGATPTQAFSGTKPDSTWADIDFHYYVPAAVPWSDLRVYAFASEDNSQALQVTVNTGQDVWDEAAANTYEQAQGYTQGFLGFPAGQSEGPEYHISSTSGVRAELPFKAFGYDDYFATTNAGVSDILKLPLDGAGESSFPVEYSSLVGFLPFSVAGYASPKITSAKAGGPYSNLTILFSASGWGTAPGETAPTAIGYGELPIGVNAYGNRIAQSYFEIILSFDGRNLDVENDFFISDYLQVALANTQKETISVADRPLTFYNPQASLQESVLAATKQRGDLVTALAELLQSTDSLGFTQIARISEQLQVAGLAQTFYHGLVEVLAGMAIANEVRPAYSESATDAISASETLEHDIKLLSNLINNISVADSLTNLLTISVLVTDSAELSDSSQLSSHLLAEILDSVDVYTLLRLPDLYAEGWAMNTEGSQPISEYGNFAFNSLTFYKGTMYSAADAGIYTHTASTDDGENITAEIASMMLDFGTSRMKRVRSAYLGYTASKELVLKVRSVSDGEVSESWYKATQNKVSEAPEGNYMPVGQGLKSRYWQFELTNVDGGDFEVDQVELHPLILNRRV